MYVYLWKTPDGIPFYVGMGATVSRANPKGFKSRNRFCRAEVLRIGIDAVIVELHTISTEGAAKEKEQGFIQTFGTCLAGTGTLTNISKGGEYHVVSAKTKKTLQERWQDPGAWDRYVAPRIGHKRELPESTKNTLRAVLANNPEMKSWGERNGKDPEFDTKRIAGIKAAQPKRAEKMRDPEALAQRKDRLRATLNSPKHKARRDAQNTPEYRAAASARKLEYWAKKRAEMSGT